MLGPFPSTSAPQNFQFEVAYTYTRDLTNINGVTGTPASGFANEFGNTL